ncbi:MAG: EAL domain-containing protein [Rickettsiales bacterium]|nr:EAL domain-containing protein [Rickettsiales bacterium]
MRTITREAEIQLIEELVDIQEVSNRWMAVCFRFSQLLEHYKSEPQIKIAINIISGLVNHHEASVYICEDGTMFVLVADATKPLIDKMVFQLRYLFMDDPLAYLPDGEENENFSVFFDLGENYDAFMKVCKARLGKKIKSSAQSNPATMAAAPAKMDKSSNVEEDQGAVGLPPLDLDKAVDKTKSDIKFFNATSLSAIERDLQNADLSKVIRRQPICAALPETMVRRVFDELYINIAHLRKMLGVDVDLLSNRWLFKYLTQVLDERVLHLLQRSPKRYLDNPISLNLNVHTLLSNRFAEFDASIKPAVKVSIVIEIQLADVFNDMAAFLVAKDAVQKLGYRVCLDGVTDLSFMQIDRKRLGFDLVKLQWNANLTTELQQAHNLELADQIRECGVNRVILTRCDSREAVDYGQAMGVTLFQGRYLDTLMNPSASVKN